MLKGSKKLYAAAGSESLRTAFEMNYTQIETLKQVFSCIGLSARGKKYKAMGGLLEEADKITESFPR